MVGQYLIVAQYTSLDNVTTGMRLSIQYKSSTQEGIQSFLSYILQALSLMRQSAL